MSTEKAMHSASGREVRFGWKPATSEMRKRSVPLAPFVKRYGGKPPPASIDYGAKAKQTLALMLNNDREGNCVLAATLHGIGVWTANEPGGKENVPTAQECSTQYRAICGPGDNGCYIPNVLDHFRDRGITAAGKGRKIEGYVRVNPRDQLLVKIATHLFGGLHLGVNWPADWMNESKPGGVLRPGDNRIVGGHAVQVVGYDGTGLLISTWGIVCCLSWDSLADPRYVDECYAMIGEDWWSDSGATAAGEGIDVKALREAFDVLKGGGTPTYPDDPTPPTPPAPPNPPANVLWEFLREFDVFGFTIHLHAALMRNPARGAGGVNWYQALLLAWNIVRAVRSGDWFAALEAAQALVVILADLFQATGNDPLARMMRGMGEALAKNAAGKLGGPKACECP